MTNDIESIMIFFCKDKALSKARLAKMVYLADWLSCLRNGRQLTNLSWYYDHYGPYLKNFYEIAQTDPRFSIHPYANAEMISVQKDVKALDLSDDALKILEEVKQTAQAKPFREFLKQIYATYPIVSNEQYSQLNLPLLAQEYRRKQATAIV